MALADVQSLWTNEMKPWIIGRNSYEDVYIGAAASLSAIITNANHYELLSKGNLVSISNASNAYLWIVLPTTYTPTMLMSGLEVPMTLDSTATIGTTTYNVYKSNNLYSGTFKVCLI